MEHFDLIIDGKRVSSDHSSEIRNPATGEAVGSSAVANAGHLDSAVQAARRAFPGWRDTPSEKRAEALNAIADRIEAASEDLAKLLTLEQGKPLNGLGSRFEMGGAVAWTRHTATLDLPVEVLQEGPQGRVELHRKPIGVVGSITPWNYPVMIACWHIMPAIRVGNTVVMKPSPYTPLATLRLVELINEVLPPGVVNCVAGGNELGAWISEHPGIDKITFTGSAATGRKVMGSAVPTLKRLTLELGGNDAGIVLPGADPQEIAAGLFWSAFINSGQTCAALKRLYVHDTLYEPVCEALAAYATTVTVGNGLDEGTALGPLQNRAQFDIVSTYVDEAREQGARILTGGAPMEGPGYFYPVTLVADIDHGAKLVDDEQFGPALPIIRYSEVSDAITKANSSPAGLGGSVWGPDPAEAKRVAAALECGSVWINKHGAIQPNVPFGGIKQSGVGVEFGVEGLKDLTTLQAVFE